MARRIRFADAVAQLTALPGQRTNGVGSLALAPELASAGLIDEYRLDCVPIFLGAIKAAISQICHRVNLRPVETRTFPSGTTRLRCVPLAS
jgi:dihydrofolate reductase